MPEKVDIQLFKLSDVAVNDGTDGKPCWIIIRDSVYNVTNYLDEVTLKNHQCTQLLMLLLLYDQLRKQKKQFF